MRWECHICHRQVEHHNYTNHVASHRVGDVMRMRPQPAPSHTFVIYDTVDYSRQGAASPAHAIPPRMRALTPLGHDRPLHPGTPDEEAQSSEPDERPGQRHADRHRRTNHSPLGRTQTSKRRDSNHRGMVLATTKGGPSPSLGRLVPRNTSSLSPARSESILDHIPLYETLVGRTVQPNAFRVWLSNAIHPGQKYTTIDGQKSRPDSQTGFRQAAEILRRTTKDEIVKIVEGFKGSWRTGNDKATCLELVRKVPIFPGLVAYTYTHLSLCPRRRRLLGKFFGDDQSDRVYELKQLVEKWSLSGDMHCVLACSLIKNRLLGLIRAAEFWPEEHRCNPALLDGVSVLKHDVLNLAAVVALCITGPKKTDILDKRGAEAEGLVDLFYNLLEANVELDDEYRRCFFNPLVKFVKESGYCPRGIYLEGGTIRGLVTGWSGAFGDVSIGRLGSRPVAVKALKRRGQSLYEYNKRVSKEAIVWGHFRHPNCLPLYGVCRMPAEGPNICVALVSPWMGQGDLFTYLERNPGASRTQLILDIVHGLSYLHSMRPRVAHRDIKPDNILVTRRGRACLADFGLASAFDSDDRFRTATSQIVMTGTCPYLAPEIFTAASKEDKRKVNKRACDMYALGCTIYAIYTGTPPFDEMTDVEIRARVISNKRPDFPQGRMPPDMWSFVENLWCQDPQKRLTAEMALGWMRTKAHWEGVDSNLAPLEEEWEWKGPRGNECLWSVSV